MKLLRHLFLWLALATCAAQPVIAQNAKDATGIAASARNGDLAGTNFFGATGIDPTLTPRLVNALANAANGAALTQQLFAFVGDSTMAGTRGTGDLKTNSYPWKMLPLLSPYMAIDENGWYGNQTTTNTIAELTAYDTRLTAGAGVGIDTAFSIGGYAVAFDSATGPLTFTPTKAYDTLDLVMNCGGTASSTVSIQFGSGSTTNVTCTVNNYTLTTLTKTLGTEPVIVTKVSGAPRVQAMTLRNSTVPKVMIANMAKAGSSSVDWASTASNRSPLSVLAGIKPAAVFVNLGINDYSNSVPVATFRTNMQFIITQLKANSDVILGIPFPSNASIYTTQGQYVQVIRDLAVANNVPLVDFSRLMVSYEFSQPLGRYVDNRHPTNLGYQITAGFMAQRIRNQTGF